MEGQLHVGELASRHAPNCPYCHSEIASDDASVWTCPRCGTRHHDGCAGENGGCTLLGCGARYEGRANAHWPDAHRARVPLEREAEGERAPLPTAHRQVMQGGGVLCAVGAVLVIVGALLELPGPSRDIA